LEWLEKEDIIKRVVSLEFNRLIEYYVRRRRSMNRKRVIEGQERGCTFGERGRRQHNGVVQPEKGMHACLSI
jgi:ATP-dependent RNA helicase DeaD